MDDRIVIENLIVPCHVGKTARERQRKQMVVIDVSLYLDLSEAAKTDSIRRTVDYSQARRDILAFVTISGEFKLIEALTEGLATTFLQKYPFLTMVSLKVRKKKYSTQPVLGVEITRQQGKAV